MKLWNGKRMLSIHEYQSMELLGQYGIPIPHGQIAGSPEEAQRITKAMGGII